MRVPQADKTSRRRSHRSSETGINRRAPEITKPTLVSASISELGFTLVELVVVIVLIAVISSLAISRLDNVMLWKQRSAVREFGAVWEVLFGEAQRRGKRFRLVINLDDNSYTVRQENPALGDQARQIDTLANLRLDSEKQRREQAEQSNVRSAEDQLKEEDYLASFPLESQYYMTLGADAGMAQLSMPTSMPNLGNRHLLVPPLRIRDVVTSRGRIESGTAVIRFSPLGGSEFAVVHFLAGDGVITMLLNPATGELQTFTSDVNFDWAASGGNKQ